MTLCSVALRQHFTLPRGQEIVITWDNAPIDVNRHHTKPEYIKIHADGSYHIGYSIQWTASSTSQPLFATIYTVLKDFSAQVLHRHATVAVSKQVNLNKDFRFQLNANERICLGVKNMSTADF